MADFELPEVSFHDDHVKQKGQNTPNCQVRIWIASRVDNGGDVGIEVVVSEESSGTELARGKVVSTGNYKLHELRLMRRQPLQLDRVVVKFECGDANMEGLRGAVWMRCA